MNDTVKDIEEPNTATDWLVALRERPDDPALHRAFDAWRAASPENEIAWQEAEHTASLLAALAPAQSGPAIPLPDLDRAPPPVKPRRTGRRLLAGAGLALAAILTRSYTLTITQLLAMIVIVISYGNEVLVGYDKGAGDNETAFRRAVKNAVMTGIAVTGIAAGLWLGGEFLIGLFTQDAAVVAAVQTILMLHIIVTPFQTVNLILFNSLKAAGDVNRPVIVNLSITFALALPLVWLFADYLEYGVEGLWYALILEEMAKGTAMFLLWRYRSWQRLKLVEDTDGTSSYAV